MIEKSELDLIKFDRHRIMLASFYGGAFWPQIEYKPEIPL
jgi:hypothetical protein